MPLCKYCLGITLEDGRAPYAHQPSWRALQSSAKECPLCRLFKEELHANLAYVRRNTDGFADLTEDSIAKRGLLDDDLPQDWDVDLQTNMFVSFYREDSQSNKCSRLLVRCGLENDQLHLPSFANKAASYIQFRELQKGKDHRWFSRRNIAWLDAYTHKGFDSVLGAS